MSDLDTLRRKYLDADKAGRADEAAQIAAEIKAQMEKQASPQEPSLLDALKSGGPKLVQQIMSGVAQTVLHPVDTATDAIMGPGKLVAGGLSKLGDISPHDQSASDRLLAAAKTNPDYAAYAQKNAGQFEAADAQNRGAFEGLLESYKKYGSMKGIKDKIANDPASILTDAATLLTGGAAKIPMLERAGQLGRAIAPTKVPAKIIEKAVEVARGTANSGMKEMIEAVGNNPDPNAHSMYAASPGTEALAKELIVDPGKALDARKGLLDVIRQHMEGSDARQGPYPAFDQDTRMGSRYLAFDADALRPHFATALQRANTLNDADAYKAIEQAQKSLSELKKPKDPISRYSQAIGVYDAVDKIANKMPDKEIVSTLRNDVRNTLSQDPDIKQAFSQLDEDKRAYADRQRTEKSSNRTDKSLLDAAEQTHGKDAKRLLKNMVKILPYRGAGVGAGLGYMMATNNWSPAMYALAGAGGEGAAKMIARMAKRPEMAKENMMNMMGGGVDEILAKIEDYKKRGKNTNTLIENLLMALAQSHQMQQQQGQ